ncbi:MAG: thioredoxin [Alphaproteobacteria bacterium]
MSTINLGPSAPPKPKTSYIKDATTKTFQADVIEASRKQPVVVDFWAPWCGPCKTLGPIIEKLVNAAQGAVQLVKINVDENPEIAQALRIQSIPTVYAFKNGQPVDGFAGALPESQVKTFLERLAGPVGPSPIDEMIAEGEALIEEGDVAMAAQAFAAVLQEQPGEPRALAGLSRSYLRAGDIERAKQTLSLVPPEAEKHQAIASVRAELDLADKAGDGGDTSALKAKVAAEPQNYEARFDLAMALVGANQHEEAVSELLEIVRRDRKWNDEAARKQLLTIFEALGPTHEVSVSGRRRLSSILFS